MAPKQSCRTRIPSLCHHKPSDQAFVLLNGRRIYLGKWGSPGIQQAYDREIAEWIARGRQPLVEATDLTLCELIAGYWSWCKEYYTSPDGKQTSTLHSIKQALETVKNLYGYTAAVDFGPKALRIVRDEWIAKGLARKTVNDYTKDVRRMFRWAVSQEMIPVTTHQALTTVDGLKRGRSAAKETEPVKPVPDADIEAVKPHVSRQVKALIELQLLTGARAGELLLLRPQDIDTTGEVWSASLKEHKTAYRGHERTIYFGPRAQTVLREFLLREPTAYLFSPKEAEKERYAKSKCHRRAKQPVNPNLSGRTLRDHYTTDTYRRAIEYGCIKAKVPVWTPHRLRHNAATAIRKSFGLEAAQVLLGHARADVTQVYAEANHEKAVAAVQVMG